MTKTNEVVMTYEPSARVSVRSVVSGMQWEEAAGLCPVCSDLIECSESVALIKIDAPTTDSKGKAWGIAHLACMDNPAGK